MRGEKQGYDAFISYSHRLDAQVAARLQSGLQRFAKPWYKLRALRVFRDETSLAASPHLWTSIEEALSESRWMILMASRESARSEWVAKEIAWWREHRPINNLLVAVTDGDLAWNRRAGDLDWTVTDSLSQKALSQAFRQEPRWVDMRWARKPDEHLRLTDPRMQGAVADLAAAIRHIPKDSLIGEHVRQQHKTRRITVTAVLVLVVLLAASVAAAFVAKNQSDRATRQATIAKAGLLAATAKSLTGSRVDLAQLFAVKAYQLHPDPQTESALYDVLQAAPSLVRYLHTGGEVSAVASSADGRTIVTGTTSGLLQRWQLPTWKPTIIAQLHQKVTSVAVSAHGTAIIAAGATKTAIWGAGTGVKWGHAKTGWSYTAVGTSPTGRYALWALKSAPYHGPSFIEYVDLLTGRHRFTYIREFYATNIAAPDDSEFIAFSGGTGVWYRFRIPGMQIINSQRDSSFGVHSDVSTLSPGGGYFSYSNGGATLPVWVSHPVQAPGPGSPDLVAQAGGNEPVALAVSADGHRVALADPTTIYVSRATARGRPTSLPEVLTGSQPNNPGILIFLGYNGDRLLSASGDLLTLWDLSQFSRIESSPQMPVKMPVTCNICEGPQISISPDGKAAIITNGSHSLVVSVTLGASLGQQRILGDTGNAYPAPSYGPAVWSFDGKKVFIFDPFNGGGQIRSASSNMPVIGRLPGASPSASQNQPVAVTLSADGKRIIEVDVNAAIKLRTAATGQVTRTIKGPPGMTVSSLGRSSAAIDPAGEHAAVIDFGKPERQVYVINIATGRSHAVRGGRASGVGYLRHLLLIQRQSGALEVRSTDGSRLIRTIQDGPDTMVGPVTDGARLAVIGRADSQAVIVDVRSGSIIGTFTLPNGGVRAWSTTPAFTPNGSRLVMATESEPGNVGKLTELNLSVNSWLRIACTTAGHSLTAAQWRQYLALPVPEHLGCRP